MRAFFTLSNAYAADKRLLYRQLYIQNAFRFSNFVAAQFSKTLCAHVWVRVVTTSRWTASLPFSITLIHPHFNRYRHAHTQSHADILQSITEMKMLRNECYEQRKNTANSNAFQTQPHAHMHMIRCYFSLSYNSKHFKMALHFNFATVRSFFVILNERFKSILFLNWN